MKTIALLGLLFSAHMAQAVVTKNCPETLNVTLNDFQLNYVIDDNFEPQDLNDVPYDGWNGPGMIKLRKRLKKEGQITAKLDLSWSGSARCEYRGQTSAGKFASASLSGSLRPGAAKPAVMVFYNGALAAYINLADIQKTGLTATSQNVPLYYQGEYCSWGDCIPDHIKIANGKLGFLK